MRHPRLRIKQNSGSPHFFKCSAPLLTDPWLCVALLGLCPACRPRQESGGAGLWAPPRFGLMRRLSGVSLCRSAPPRTLPSSAGSNARGRERPTVALGD